MEFWIYMLRQWNDNLAIGPYAKQAYAEYAMENSLLIDGLAQEDCLDCWISDEPVGEEFDQLIIDPTDHHHTGERA